MTEGVCHRGVGLLRETCTGKDSTMIIKWTQAIEDVRPLLLNMEDEAQYEDPQRLMVALDKLIDHLEAMREAME